MRKLPFSVPAWLSLTWFLSVFPGGLLAAPIIEFLPGNISLAQIGYAGGAAGLATSLSIPIATIRGTNTPVATSDLAVTNGSLDFVTGSLTAFSTNGGSAWDFAPGGSITVVGGVPALGIPDGTTLLSGSFDNTVSLTGTDPTLATDGFLVATFSDTKDLMLLASFGLDPDTQFRGALTLTGRLVDFPGEPLPAFVTTGIGSVSLVNIASVPVPTTLALLVLGLAGFRWKGRIS
jgi:hypothetical protein